MSTANAPDEDSEAEPEYEVDFTSDQARAIVTCQRCSKTFPPGTKLKMLHSKTPGGSDRFFCSVCFEYYRTKKTTVRRTTRTQQPGNSKQGVYKSKY